MYDGCFGLNRRPFVAVPQIEQYYPAAAIEGARNHFGPLHPTWRGGGASDRPVGHGQDVAVPAAGRAVPAFVPGGDAAQRAAEHPPRPVSGHLVRIGPALSRPGRRRGPAGRGRLSDGRRRQLARHGAAGRRGPHAAASPVGRNPPADQLVRGTASRWCGWCWPAGPRWRNVLPARSSTRSASVSAPLLPRSTQPHGNRGLHSVADQRGRRLRRAGLPRTDMPERFPGHRRRAPADQSGVRPCPAAGLRGRPATDRAGQRRRGLGRSPAIADAMERRAEGTTTPAA